MVLDFSRRALCLGFKVAWLGFYLSRGIWCLGFKVV